jgi:archaeosine synthase
MTRYFEVEQRDGAARIGKLLLSEEIKTPYILNATLLGNLENPGPIVDAGSLWSGKSREEFETRIRQIQEKTGNGTLIILPHQAYPPSISIDVKEKCESFNLKLETINKENIEGMKVSKSKISLKVPSLDLKAKLLKVTCISLKEQALLKTTRKSF